MLDIAPPAPGARRPGALRVATQNLWEWYYFTDAGIGRSGPDGARPPAWTARQAVLADGFHDLQPDVVAFQEAIKAPSYDQVVELLGPTYQVVHQSGRQADGSGASIASRWPIADVHEVDLHVTTRTAGFPCVALVAEILAPVPIGPMLVVNHNPNWELELEYERELQAVVAAQAIEDIAGRDGRHVVLAGDFNATPDAASMRFWSGLQSLHGVSVQYRDTWPEAQPGKPEHTFTPDNPVLPQGTWPQERGRRIDYILVRCVHHGPTLDVTACARIFDRAVDGVWASDHFGVAADLRIPTRAPATLY
jgi:endonuclease/exonuclease/phosphatase family metal-dependent hydrolase